MRTSGCSPSSTPAPMPHCSERTAVYLGAGIVGGWLMSIDDLSRSTADVAVRLLNGAPVGASIRHCGRPGEPTFDWRELQRWGIRREPPAAGQRRAQSQPRPVGGTQRHRAVRRRRAGHPIAAHHRPPVAAPRAAAGRERQPAEPGACRRRQSPPDDVGADRTRLRMSSVNRSAAMIHNAEALSDDDRRQSCDARHDRARSCPTSETQGVQAAQIIDRHRTMLRSHQLDRKPIDLHAVIHDSLALVAHDLRSAADRSHRQSVVESLRHQRRSRAPAAGAGEPGDERHGRDGRDAAGSAVTSRSRTEVRAADVELSVRDTGTGLPAHIDGTLFTPFVTTKAHGLGVGLTIVRTIVEAHGGTIDAHNNADGGATFTVTLPRIERPQEPVGGVRCRMSAPPCPGRGRPPRSGESRLPAAGDGLRGRGNRRRRQRRAGRRAAAPARRDRGRPQPPQRQRARGVSSDHRTRTRR